MEVMIYTYVLYYLNFPLCNFGRWSYLSLVAGVIVLMYLHESLLILINVPILNILNSKFDCNIQGLLPAILVAVSSKMLDNLDYSIIVKNKDFRTVRVKKV